MESTINNTIIAQNTGASYYPNLRVDGTTVSGYHNLIGDGTGQTFFTDGIDGNQVGTAASPIDPLFVDLQSYDDIVGWDEVFGTADDGLLGDYHVLVASPAIDAGSNLYLDETDSDAIGPDKQVDLNGSGLIGDYTIALDLSDLPRVARGTVDIGAYESHENWAPVLDPIGGQIVEALTELTFTAIATDGDLPDQSLTFSLDAGAPDDGTPPLDDSQTFAVLVGHFDDFVVNSTDGAVDANPGDGLAETTAGVTTLRAAIMEANALPGDQTIVVPAGTYTLGIVGVLEDAAANGDLDITDATGTLTITGAGAGATIIDGAGLDRVFDVRPGASADIAGVTITGGHRSGGGIWNNGTLTVSDSTISGNQADGTGADRAGSKGGGIYNAGSLTIQDSTIENNSVTSSRHTGYGGGIYSASGPVTISGSIISSNQTEERGGGLCSESGTVTITDTMLSFDFSSTLEGEMHAIGFDDNLAFGGGVVFQLFGTQRVGFNDFNNYTTADGVKHYEIPVGQFFTGNVAHLLFSNDHDAAPSNGESIFSNIRIYENDPSAQSSGDMAGVFLSAMESPFSIGEQNGILRHDESAVSTDDLLATATELVTLSEAELTRIAYDLAEVEREAAFGDDESQENKAVDLLMRQDAWDV